MGYTASFFDSIQNEDGTYSVTYGRDDFNAITQNIVGAGVAPFPNKDTYTTSELNNLTSAIVRKGTELGGLRVTLSDGVLHIAEGIGYFANGATVTVDSDGVDIEYTTEATEKYVSAVFNASLNTCDFCLSDTEPADSDGIYTLYLAAVKAGTVTDKRTIATMKVASDAPHVVQEVEWDGSVTGTPAKGDLVYSLPLISSSFKHIYVYRKPASYETEIYQASLLDLQNNVFTHMMNGASTSYMSLGQTEGSIYSNYGRNSSSLLNYKIEDGYLNFYLSQNSGTYSPAALHIVLS